MTYIPNPIAQGLEKGLTSLGAGLIQGEQRRSARDIYNQTLDEITKSILPPKPVPQQNMSTDPIANSIGSMGNLYQQSTNPQIDYSKAGDVVRQGITKLMEFGDIGKPYGQGLESFYESKIPQTELKNVGDSLLEIKKDPKTMNYDINKLYQSDPKLTSDPQIPISMYEKDGKYYATQTMRDAHGNLTSRDDEVGADVYNTWKHKQEIEQSKLTDPEKYQNKIDFKMMFPSRSGSHRKKTTDIESSKVDKDTLKDIDTYGKLKRMDWAKMSDKQKEQYKQLNDRISSTTGKNADDITNELQYTPFKNDKERLDYLNKNKGEEKSDDWSVVEKIGGLDKLYGEVPQKQLVQQKQAMDSVLNWAKDIKAGTSPQEILDMFFNEDWSDEEYQAAKEYFTKIYGADALKQFGIE